MKRSLVTVLFHRQYSTQLIRDRAFINGQWVAAASGQTFDVTNPANNKLITKVTDCHTKETQSAIKAASEAFKSWGFTTLAKERSVLLLKLADLLVANKTELAKIMTAEQGKPLSETEGEVLYSVGYLEWFGQEARRINGEILPTNMAGRQLFHFKEPDGVAALISPWNFPIAMMARKMSAALAAGCTCVVKPAEDTPLSALAVAALVEKAGFPPGVFNVLPASRTNTPAVGLDLCQSPDVAVVSFTGSTPVGKLLLAQSASTVKRVHLELGGNASFIVFNSANLQTAVDGCMQSKFRNQGQTCVCANRIFVQEEIFDDFIGQLAEAIKKLQVGDGMNPGVTQGPLINAKAVEKVENLLKDAKGKGAKVVLGGEKHPAGPNFFQPTLLTGVTPEMEIFQQEIFGPIASVIKFKTEEEVVRMANNTRVGLASYFYSADLPQIFRVSRRLEVGMVGVNAGLISSIEAAFGGVKETGQGREGSHVGVDEFTHVKYVCLGGL